MQLESRILEVIKENLTQQQIGLLKDYFNQSSENEKELAQLREYKKNASVAMENLIKERDELKAKQKDVFEMHKTAMSLAAETAKQKQELELTIAKANLDACKSSYMEMKDLIATVFRNPRFIHTQEHIEHHNAHSTPNGWCDARTVQKTFTTKTEQE